MFKRCAFRVSVSITGRNIKIIQDFTFFHQSFGHYLIMAIHLKGRLLRIPRVLALMKDAMLLQPFLRIVGPRNRPTHGDSPLQKIGLIQGLALLEQTNLERG